ncbi:MULTISPECIES: short-chain fatty acyl-CoA regulator family protein [unclassified Novosphingobium]|uniref:helix-turn-helix domain-containing protein n=1 Tax=unclassified Novosphingobium TaxID=2644732 RepID=UPI000EF072D1|nr:MULTISPECIES: short-chain fatty acyl-CoA regulator family protein [unclassified Novosphingobium]HCF25388.1 XRE family transcriptional regulator [Novosphingobium sp.]HQV04143.1 short-chain fatty acyl-CoA regulator family protein [Novosphingobium sp.]
MVETAILAGPAIRRLRRREGLTQAAMASRLGISPSYLNLIERNQRPLSARLLVQLAEAFEFDPRSLRQDEAVGGVDGLRRRLADERFADLGIDRDEVTEWLAAAPQAALAFARLYDAAGADAGSSSAVASDPMNLARREIERWRNHFADLDVAAEELADELRLSNAEIGAALAERLRQKHQLSLRILPYDVMPDALRRLDLHARQLQLSELLDQSSRNFQVALQLAMLEQGEAIAAIADGARFADRSAWRLFRRHLAGYFAAALLMPYGRFMRACEGTGYDLTILQRRFNVGFEQLAHRLTTLQRVGQRGLPFFMARIDRAGQFSKRYAGASGTTMLESDASCPLWNVHRAFEQAGRIQVQSLEFAESSGQVSHWVTMGRTVEGSAAAPGGNPAQFAVVLGLEAQLAAQLSQARALPLDPGQATPIGPGCARCHRSDCQQRSLPPRGAALQFDERSRGLTPFAFGR